jgi:predicted hydrolase (HD superfamily)
VVNRFDLFLVVRNQLGDRALVRRSLAVEAVMEALARACGGDAELWGLIGLGADIDAALVARNPERRGEVAAQLLRTEGLPAEAVQAVRTFRAGRIADLPPLALALVAASAMVAHLEEDGPDARMLEHRLRRGEERPREALAALGLDLPAATVLAAEAYERSKP